ncbi:hypothetical protein MHBO_005106 [Bonamia ostreae]|uniref:Uncharacterized protein n=1 Tax=Bonamia ostreae TaxID=126728 RepID=A0ABV2AV39_9EUKA
MKGLKQHFDPEGIKRQFYYNFKKMFFTYRKAKNIIFYFQTGRARLAARKPHVFAILCILGFYSAIRTNRFVRKRKLIREWNDDLALYKKQQNK